MKQYLARQWFLVALLMVLAVGFNFGAPLRGFAAAFPVWALVAFVLFLMSWSLDSTAMLRAVRYPLPATLGVAVNFVLLPAVAFGISRFLPPPMDAGLILTAAVPCTLASAAVWTRRAGGNDAVALVITMVTNFSCFLVTPALIWLMTGTDARDQLEPAKMVVKLIYVAVLPMMVGQLLRMRASWARWATANKFSLATVAQVGILTMVLIASVKSSMKIEAMDSRISIAVEDILLATAALHLITLFAGFGLGRALNLPRADWIATGIAGSQKTLMLGVYIADAMGLGAGMLPMVAYHAVQLIIDTVVADKLSRGASADQ